MRIKGMEGGISLKNVKVPQKFNQWARETQNRIKIQQQAERLGKAEQEALLRAEPEPGYGLDGYPLQKSEEWRVKSGDVDDGRGILPGKRDGLSDGKFQTTAPGDETGILGLVKTAQVSR